MHTVREKNKLREAYCSFEDRKLGRTASSVSEKEHKLTRGYVKLNDAVDAFNFDFRDKVVLDIGSSTGGFTEIALEHGAKKVIAVEKGTNQMKRPLRYDPRIELHEKTDIFDIQCVSPAMAAACPSDTLQAALAKSSCSAEHTAAMTRLTIEAPDVIIADVSFISLTKILKHAKDYLSNKDTDFLVMLKPQFEARPDQLNRGVVKNEKIRRDIIKNFEFWLKQNGFIIVKKRDNDLSGKNGNLERFYWLKNQLLF